MDLGIRGKRAVVIGGSSGLGKAAAEALAKEGVHIVLFARNQDALMRTRHELSDKFQVGVEFVVGDVTKSKDVDALASTLSAGRGVDIVILNTPRPPSPMRDFLDENDDARWEQAYHDQLYGALLVLRRLTPLLLPKGWGRIVAITSASVKNPMTKHAISTVFRAGVQGALKHLANETASHGVTVNSVAPATISTPTFGQFHDVEARVQAVPVKRFGKPEELGALVAFLASDLAGFITGQVVQLDGGQTPSLL